MLYEEKYKINNNIDSKWMMAKIMTMVGMSV